MDNTNDPQIVLVMNEIDAINFRKKGYEKPGCKVIAFDGEFKSELAERLGKQNLLVDKNVLVKDLYTSDLTYYPLDTASKNIHVEYFKRYASVLSLLGVAKVYVSEVNTVNESESTGGSVKGGAAGLGGKVSGKYTSDSSMQELMRLKQSCVPKVDLQAAKKLMERFSLQNDQDLNRVIATVEAGTEHKSYDFFMVLSQKLQKVFDLAASITPYAGINIKADMARNKEITKTYTLHVIVEFGDPQENG
ncbi:MAG: hypothetical protein IKP09_06830 [Lentisphaeria bacterium]|nr:hypothetical protein [Lentisphaeria bacterium]